MTLMNLQIQLKIIEIKIWRQMMSLILKMREISKKSTGTIFSCKKRWKENLKVFLNLSFMN
jgi:hypothetical protein